MYNFDLSGRAIFITGASSGIGAQIAKAVYNNNGSVILAARRRDKLEALKDELKGAKGEVLVVEMDATDEESTVRAFNQAEERFGQIHGLFANAGVGGGGAIVDHSVEDFDFVYSVNLRGIFLSVKEAGKRMIASDVGEKSMGRILINSSYTATHVNPGLSLYSATKAGAVQFGRVCAREWANKGINVNVICPGYLRTEMNAAMFETKHGERLLSKFPRKRIMDPDALNAIALYLLSDASQFVTGSVFQVDDGQSL